MSRLPLSHMEPRGFIADQRYQMPENAAPSDDSMLHKDSNDPVLEAWERGFAEGQVTARKEHEAAAQERDVRLAGLEDAFVKLGKKDAEDLAEKLRQTVMLLCEQVIMPTAFDSQDLAQRIDKAAAMLTRAGDERTIRLNPEDLPLVQDLVPDHLILMGDMSLERGSLRIDTPEGGVEDGPHVWRRQLEQALGQC